ncbi:MAG TPA: hypothetical protein VF763_13595 [Candidatus Limnocylindrales bacterium]
MSEREDLGRRLEEGRWGDLFPAADQEREEREDEAQSEARARGPRNREERRAERFDRAPDHVQDNLQPASENDPAFGRGGDDQEAYTGRPDEDVTRETGAGTGGATESDGRLIRHEGMHLGNQPNS